MKLLYAVGIVVLAVLIFSSIPPDEAKKQPAPLDYSRPIFTKYGTIVCPTSLLFDMRADHAPDRIAGMFNSLWSRSDKAHELGCEEFQQGLLVSATRLETGVALVTVPGGSGGSLFTVEDELTNDVPGQSDVEKRELAEAHITSAPVSTAPSSSSSSLTLGHALVTFPSHTPILTGDGVAKQDSNGFGAVICPDSDSLAASSDYKRGESEDDWSGLKRYGCSYVPPGTPLVSEGPNAQHSLAVVRATLPDGTTISGVTFPDMFVRNQRQPKEPEQQALAGRQEQLGAAVGQPSQPQPGADQFQDGGKNGVGFPSCLYCPEPQPTQEARALKIQGSVELQVVIQPDGRATNIQIVKGLGYGLDELAVDAVRSWRFKPATGPDGEPVATLTPIEIEYRLQ